MPIAAAGIVIWLAARSYGTRGPDIQISFKVAEGLQERQSTIQHRGVVIGTVERLELTDDMSHVIVHARMMRSATKQLNENTRFYIVAPHVGIEGITGLSTLVSGSYIEMSPATGTKVARQFVGFEEPPILRPDTPGRFFTMTTPDLGSLTRGSPISFKGINVGEVEGYKLAPDGSHVSVTAFIHAPHDKLVHPETRFWNAGGVDVSVGAQGIRVRANSWQQLLSGGIAFETPESALNGPQSEAGAVFALYDTKGAADRDPRGEALIYVAGFTGNLRGLDEGTAVELEGSEIGRVRNVQLSYDAKGKTLATLVTIAIDPDKLHILNLPQAGTNTETAQKWIETLVGSGLRAQVMTANYITGFKIVTLDMVKGAPPAKVQHVGEFVQLPTAESGDVAATLASLRDVLKNIDRATSGPQLGHAIASLDSTLTHLDQLTTDVQPDLKALIKSLRDTSDAAQGALTSVRGLVGGDAASGGAGPDVQRLMQELTDAARSVRGLADYLDRHPEALLRGRSGEQK